MNLTKLFNLAIDEVSAVPDPAHLVPGWIVRKGVQSAAPAAADAPDLATIVDQVITKNWSDPADQDAYRILLANELMERGPFSFERLAAEQAARRA